MTFVTVMLLAIIALLALDLVLHFVKGRAAAEGPVFEEGTSYSVYTAFPTKRFSGEVVKVTGNWVLLSDQERKSLSKGEVWVQISHIIAVGPKE